MRTVTFLHILKRKLFIAIFELLFTSNGKRLFILKLAKPILKNNINKFSSTKSSGPGSGSRI